MGLHTHILLVNKTQHNCENDESLDDMHYINNNKSLKLKKEKQNQKFRLLIISVSL